MLNIMRVLIILIHIKLALCQWETNYVVGHAGMVHLFEWHWSTIAEECENFLGPKQFGGVQVSPPTENRIVPGRPWYERYQPISYVIGTRSGDRAAFQDMIDRCNAVGVRIYVDAVINHMCKSPTGAGVGTAGSPFDTTKWSFPAVPYTSDDFNDQNCHTSNGGIQNYGDKNQVRNCQLQTLLDLNHARSNVRKRIVDFMNDMISMGVAGFRVDAAKHMWPNDLNAIFSALNDLSTSKGFPAGSRPFLVQEVIDQGGEAIKASEYYYLGRVTEFKYGLEIGKNKDKLQHLGTIGDSWGLIPGAAAMVFLYNHDNQRGHGGGGHNLITFNDFYNLKIFNAFMMAWPYGIPRIMSSYYFDNPSVGPPENQRNVKDDGSCGNGWVCEHRWRQIANMAAFAGAADGAPVTNWWSNRDNQIAFSRGDRAFLAINKSGYDMNGSFVTGLPEGSYCNVNAGNIVNNACTGQCISVDSNGVAEILISPGSDPVVAIHVNAPCKK